MSNGPTDAGGNLGLSVVSGSEIDTCGRRHSATAFAAAVCECGERVLTSLPTPATLGPAAERPERPVGWEASQG
jgi:hypothetical protein